MKISETGIDLIKHYEGLQLQPYICPAGKATVGFGHTGPDVVFGMKITEADADKLLREDLHFAERGVETYAHAPLTQGQFDALVSFAFNLGIGALRDSTLMQKVNAKDFASAADEFGKWIHAGGKVLPGLVRRREAERALFVGNTQ
jgi:lysozyme